MAVGNIAPVTGGHYGVKSNASNFVYHDGRWVLQDTSTLYEQMPIGAVGSRTGWGDGTTQNAAVTTVTSLGGRSYDVGYDYVNEDYKVVSYKGAGGASYLHTVPYTVGTDTYGATVANKLDSGQFNNSAFDSKQMSFIVDQQGNTLIFALGDSSDGTSMSPKNGLLVAYSGFSNTNPSYAQIESGFNRNDGTGRWSLDAFTFMKGSAEWVGVVYCGSSSFKIAYHPTETTLSNYSSGWVVETIGVPAGDSVDDHICARSINGELYASVKGDTLDDHLYLIHGVIDTVTNNSSFTFYNYTTAGSRGIVALTGSDCYLIYEDRTTSPTTISYKTYPLGGLSINPASAGTVVIDADISITNPASSAHNVSSDMGFIPVSGETTNNELWHGRIELAAIPVDMSASFSATSSITAAKTITANMNSTLTVSSSLAVDYTVTASMDADLSAQSGLSSTYTISADMSVGFSTQVILSPAMTITADMEASLSAAVSIVASFVDPSVEVIVYTVRVNGVLVEHRFNGDIQLSQRFDGQINNAKFNGVLQ